MGIIFVRWSLDPKTEVLRRYTLVFPAGCVVHISKESEWWSLNFGLALHFLYN